ncbi:GTP diphosphokinase [Algicola sagamiensis]|uniref:GTP diphosphokinase n=1 Tax=Algicola sagamiensis TaxID=163869 RepID=UPI0003695EDD|nr:GTP diphosphokinase [Algicola sagamiensis]
MVSVRPTHQVALQYQDIHAWLDSLPLPADKKAALMDVDKALSERCEDQLALCKGREMVDILSELNMDLDALITALIFPVYDAELITCPDIHEIFGEHISLLTLNVEQMDAIRTIQQCHDARRSASQIDKLRHMLLAMVEDVRAVVIKLAERICYLRLVKNECEEIKVLAAKESANVFAPLANRLGIGQLKWELEDLSFRYLHPETYKAIAKQLEDKRLDREQYMLDFVQRIQTLLKAEEVHAEVDGRPKHIYSIWRKMKKKDYDFDQLFDIRAVRVIASEIQDCYGALGVIHTNWNHLASEFDDYIATPKQNGYQSIHTVVMGPEGKTVEVQIRTQQMHEDAELGVAAHWKYKEGALPGRKSSYEEKINWLRKLLQWQEEVSEDADLAEELRHQVFEDRVYVFTPKGDIVDLPAGSTPLDFAYYIHSNVGHRCIGAKISGRIVPFTYELKNGDQIDILTTKEPNPSRDWLNPNTGFIKSSRARSKIQAWFKQQDKDKNIAAGKELLESELSKIHLTLKDSEAAIERFHANSMDDFLSQVGSGDIRINQVLNFLQNLQSKDEEPEIDPRLRQRPKQAKRPKDGVIVDGVGNLMHHMAKCCQPVPGDEIRGYITQGRGIAIHRVDCEQLFQSESEYPERVIEVQWAEQAKGSYSLSVRVTAHDRSGLLRDITSILANEKISVIEMNSLSDKKKELAHVDLVLEIHNVETWHRILSKFSQIEDVTEVKRK